jgi:hypothetical protein
MHITSVLESQHVSVICWHNLHNFGKLHWVMHLKLAFLHTELHWPGGALAYMLFISSGAYLFFFGSPAWPLPAMGQPDRERCVRNEPLMCPVPSQPGVGQFTPSNFMAVAAATAALCCSTVPPFSSTRSLFRLAIGHPDALWNGMKSVYHIS